MCTTFPTTLVDVQSITSHNSSMDEFDTRFESESTPEEDIELEEADDETANEIDWRFLNIPKNGS